MADRVWIRWEAPVVASTGIKVMPYDEHTVERVRRALAGHKFVEKKVMGGLCFMVRGAMCCSVSSRGLLIRVGPELHAQMIREPHAGPMKMGRRTMSGFVRVDPKGYRTDAALAVWIERGLACVARLSSRR